MSLREVRVQDFDAWRAQARTLLAQGVAPAFVAWREENDVQHDLFATDHPTSVHPSAFRVPRAFVALAETIACHRDPLRWSLLYVLLWRLSRGERHLLEDAADPVMHDLREMEKAVRRDAHKAKAFVRFQLTHDEDGTEHYMAWHAPDHRILRLVAPFFSRRFGPMRWTILTPQESVHWNTHTLTYGPGVAAFDTVHADSVEALWREYYRAIFNPARIKLKAMRREMPVRHWRTLPETRAIPQMLAEAPERVQAMLSHMEGATISAADFLPDDPSLVALREAARGCEGCSLHRQATRTVFGQGPTNAAIMLVGEQPGDEEDRAGLPFAGPAGQVLDDALVRAGIDREGVYVTNAVKHFKFVWRAERRMHQSPDKHESRACRPWLEAEIRAVDPKVVVCLGNTAARSLIHPGFTLKDGQGRWVEKEGKRYLPTYHPSAVLRAPQEGERHRLLGLIIADLEQAKRAA